MNDDVTLESVTSKQKIFFGKLALYLMVFLIASPLVGYGLLFALLAARAGECALLLVLATYVTLIIGFPICALSATISLFSREDCRFRSFILLILSIVISAALISYSLRNYQSFAIF